MSKKILYSNEARIALEKGASKVVDSVKLTMGPKGRNVVLDRKYTSPLITNDGVTIAKDISLSDPFENIGASLIKEASIKTNDAAGDGTTTALVLAGTLIKEGQKNIAFGANPVHLAAGMKKAEKEVVNHLKKISEPIKLSESIKNVATISAGSEEIGELISKAYEKVGSEGTVSLMDSTTDTHLEVVEGMSFDRGLMSPYMATNNEKMTSELSDPYILVTDKKISSISELLPLLEGSMRAGKPLLIIADDIEQDALSALVLNKLRGTILVNAVKAPLFGEKRSEALEDIATITGATYVSSDLYPSLAGVDMSILGSANLVKISKDKTSIIGGKGDQQKIDELKTKIKNLLSEAADDYDKTRLSERLSKLSSGIAVIRVGGATEAETNEKKLRIEDALNAVKASLGEGIVAGGGIAYLSAKRELEKFIETLSGEEKIGASIVAHSLEAPFRQIVTNAGKDAGSLLSVISQNDHSETFGYDALTDTFTDMLLSGIIDPTKVEICALQNAISISIAMLSTECLVADEENALSQNQQN